MSDLNRVIAQIDGDLRGSIDGWDFKMYVLGIFSTGIFPKPNLTIAGGFL